MIPKQPPRCVLVVDSVNAGHVIARWNPLLIAVFTRAPRPVEIDLISRLVNEAVDEGIKGGLLYVVARKDLKGGVDPRLRTMFEDMIRRNQDRAGASALVILTGGFTAAIVRAAAAGMLTIMQQRKSVRVFDDLEAGCAWLASEHNLEKTALLHAYGRATLDLADLPR